MSPADAARLQQVYVREGRSLLAYVRGAAPWVGPDRELLATVTRIADDAAARRDDLAAVLDAHRITVPPPGAFPLQFTDLNFIAVRALVPKLRDDLRRELTALEADESAAADPAATAALRSLTDAHRKHLADLDAAARG